VSLTPQNAALLRKKGVSRVLVEHNAGAAAQFLDEHYAAAGATLVSREELYKQSDILLKVRPPLSGQEVERIREGSSVISFLYPAQNQAIVNTLAQRKTTAFAVRFQLFFFFFRFRGLLNDSCQMDMIPRISRAQVFDALR
jgi:NAD(P) transhydrogenase